MKKLMHIILILSLLLLPGFNPAQAQETPRVDVSSKITSALAHQIDLKRQAAVPASAEKALKTLDALGASTGDLQFQMVYIYFKSRPDSKQLAELQGMGVIPYPDSWIPPVGIHPYGFITAKSPVNSIYTLAEKTYTMKLDTAEKSFKPQNDLAAVKVNSDDLWTSSYTGTGIKVAVLDSGLELTHPDIPASVAYKDYSAWPVTDDDIRNRVEFHGTHVTGSVLGRGTASSNPAGKYKGMAPGADLIFLKIGNDTTSSASSNAMVNAIKDAKDVYGADIINISYGGWDAFMDGTDPIAQAVDYVFNKGTAVFISAGNEANDDHHYSGTVNGNSSTGYITVTYTGSNGSNIGLQFNLVWYDGPTTTNTLKLQYFDSGFNILAATTAFAQEFSPRGTERQLSYYGTGGNYTALPSGATIGYLRVVNFSPNTQPIHIYFRGVTGDGTVKFQNPDPGYTIGTPANSDSSIAVGAWVTRKTWTNWNNEIWSSSQTLDTLATFSSRGPRVDTGASPKPDIIAPGSRVISLRDRNLATATYLDSRIIDNDGVNLNRSGPADYLVAEGTSMASPVAAGAAAQLLQARPSLKGNPAKLRTILQQTAGNNGLYYASTGYGMLNILAALSYDDTAPPVPVLSSPATSAVIYSTTSPTFSWSAVTDVDNASPPILYDLRVASASSMAVPTINKTNIATNNYTLTGAESLASGTWYWQVRARDSSTTPGWNYSAWSSPAWSFSVQSTVVATATWPAGWVMWSYPFVPVPATNSLQIGDNISSLFVYHYNGSTYDFLNVAATPGWGYWTKVSTSTFVDMSGQPVASATFDIALNSSWNQIGNPYTVSVAWSSVQFIKDGVTKSLADASAAGWVSQWIYSYNTAGGGYDIPKDATNGVLNPMVGYWMKASMPNVTMRITRPGG